MHENERRSELPLTGLTVVEIGHSVAAPFAGQALADLGAHVVKVESPRGGDDARSWGPPFWHGASATFQAVNRNKDSVTLDLKTQQGRAKLFALLQEADVLIQNMRPGLLASLGLDAATVSAEYPHLIYCSIGAYGDKGPLKDQPGYDPLMQAFAGLMSVTGESGRPPVRIGPSIVDMGAGLWAVIGILAALERRRATQQGSIVDVSLFEAALSWMTIPIANTLASGSEPGRVGSETPMLAPYKAYQSRDGYIVIAAGNDNLFRRMCEAMGRSEWASDERFRTNADRVAHREALNALIEDLVAHKTAAVWVERLNAAGVPCAPLQSVAQVLAHPQTEAVDMISLTPDASMRLVRTPLRFDGVRPPIRSAAPAWRAEGEPK